MCRAATQPHVAKNVQGRLGVRGSSWDFGQIGGLEDRAHTMFLPIDNHNQNGSIDSQKCVPEPIYYRSRLFSGA